MNRTHKTISGKVVEDVEPTPYALAILNGLQHMRVYQGTVSAKDKATRRLHGRMARVSRRVNRAAR